MSVYFGGNGILPSLKGLPSNTINLPASGCFTLAPAGWWAIRTGLYTTIQEKDPISGVWNTIGGGSIEGGTVYQNSDGVNFRLANQTGCAVGALITNAGTGYTSVPTVTASAGSSIWQAIVGGAINTSPTITSGGSAYVYPPMVLISAPPAGGLQATATCTISAGAVNALTITNQGAGYTSAPTITFVNDPREGNNGLATGVGAAATATLTGAGTITGLVCLDHGTVLTSLPTLSFAGGGGASAAATTIMCWSVTAIASVTNTGGAGFNAGFAEVSGIDLFPTTAAAYTNPNTQSKLVRTRNARIKATVTANALTTTAVIYDGGIYTAVPQGVANSGGSVLTTATVPTLTMGGNTDVSYAQPV